MSRWPAFLALLLLAAPVWLLATHLDASPREVELGAHATSLTGRSSGQRHNARLAGTALNGVTIAPGATFSFNRTVRSWSVDRGYVKAPVSYDGELVRAFGGGVCQTSTTLYNAALLAGLPIVERHAHVFAPTYVAPGLDAAVAQYDIDLRFANPYPWPVRIAARTRGDYLEMRLYGTETPSRSVSIATEVISVVRPARVTQAVPARGDQPRSVLPNPGATGYRVLTYRSFTEGGRVVRRELLSDTSYQVANRLVRLRQAQAP